MRPASKNWIPHRLTWQTETLHELFQLFYSKAYSGRGSLSILIFYRGGNIGFELPITEYPEVVPPTVVVSTAYPGQTPRLWRNCRIPFEQTINGVENMLYMSSQSTSDGRLSLTVTFALGTDLDKAQVQVQTGRVVPAKIACGSSATRVVTEKSSPDLTMVVHYLAR